ncbi:putative E3 ubiquitin-protein ligase UNKL, partial [Alligator sinensis]|uniref:E3 ubiquitin-protein ligase UNKL n=1 Tax=Alligator sinensis TaxID=38654 RepID=A0A1U8DSF8_ALLSI
ACDAWQKEAQEAKERANVADTEKQLALRKKEEVEIQVIFQIHSKKCVVCREHNRSVVLQPCQHYVLCEHCAAKQQECPCCKTTKSKW